MFSKLSAIWPPTKHIKWSFSNAFEKLKILCIVSVNVAFGLILAFKPFCNFAQLYWSIFFDGLGSNSTPIAHTQCLGFLDPASLIPDNVHQMTSLASIEYEDMITLFQRSVFIEFVEDTCVGRKTRIGSNGEVGGHYNACKVDQNLWSASTGIRKCVIPMPVGELFGASILFSLACIFCIDICQGHKDEHEQPLPFYLICSSSSQKAVAKRSSL